MSTNQNKNAIDPTFKKGLVYIFISLLAFIAGMLAIDKLNAGLGKDIDNVIEVIEASGSTSEKK